MSPIFIIILYFIAICAEALVIRSFFKRQEKKDSSVPTMRNPPPPPKKKIDQRRSLKLLPGENFKWIPGYEGKYKVSDKGRILSECQSSKKIMKTRVLDNGLERINLVKDNKRKTFYVHRLVMLAFKGYKSSSVIHKDRNILNNHLENLMYSKDLPVQSNSKEVFKSNIDFKKWAKKVKCTRTGKIYDSQTEAAEKNAISQGCLSQMLNGKVPNTTTLEYA